MLQNYILDILLMCRGSSSHVTSRQRSDKTRLQTLLILQLHMLLLPVWSFNSLLSEGASLVVTCIGWRRGHKETCLIYSGTLKKTGRKKCHYPATKNGKLDCGRVRNAKARAAQQRKLSSIMSGGWKTYASKCHVKSTLSTG